MPAFCDVAVPAPVEGVFSYRVGPEAIPAVGSRVIVPFRNEKLIGVVTRLHDEPPPVEAKRVERILDAEALLPAELMELAAWISQYYMAPLGEVFRAMLPLMAEVRKTVQYRIAERGAKALHEGAVEGSSRRSRRSPEEQQAEYAVLNYLAGGEPASRRALEQATGAGRELLEGMARKRWIVREIVAAERDARRTVRYAALAPAVMDAGRMPKLNENQQALLAELAGVGGALPTAELRRLRIPESTLPSLVKRGLVLIEERAAAFHLSGLRHTRHELNAEQRAALDELTRGLGSGAFRAALLHGVTGSGKTAVYLAAMQRALTLGLASILLVPEIGLTPAMAAQLHATFGDEVALLHSALTPDERAEQWRRIRRGAARVVVGTRSAIFAPVDKLGLIVVDEEHDGSYKQEETPRYHARDVALLRAKFAGAVAVLGSATPSLESWQNAERGKYALVVMRERVNRRPLPEVELLDMRREFQETGQEQLFSRRLMQETEAALARGEQAIILLNRRGYSFAVLCRACGEKLQCENCAIALTYHKPVPAGAAHASAGQRMQCHYCGYVRTVPRLCPQCGSEHLYFLGAGSQQGEERLQELFPQARIGRMDRDTVRTRRDMERLLARLHGGEINLLVGTQMIAKGHDIHGVTLVGVVGADHALGLPDFRAAERVFQLLTQVSGRAGRGELPGKVIVQSYHPEHYAIECAQRHDFAGFVEKELKYRRWMHYPPFGALANLLIHSDVFEQAAEWAAALGKWFSRTALDRIRVLGPATAPIPRLKRIHRFHILLKAERREALLRSLRAARAYADEAGIPRRHLIFDVDPVNLM